MICVHPCGRWCDYPEIFGKSFKKTRIFKVNLNILVGVQNHVEKLEAQLLAGCGAIAGLGGLTLGVLQHPSVRLLGIPG